MGAEQLRMSNRLGPLLFTNNQLYAGKFYPSNPILQCGITGGRERETEKDKARERERERKKKREREKERKKKREKEKDRKNDRKNAKEMWNNLGEKEREQKIKKDKRRKRKKASLYEDRNI